MHVRRAEVADAESLVGYLTDLYAEPGLFLGASLDELNLSVAAERAYIERFAEGSGQLMLVAARPDDVILGVLTLERGRHRTTQHVGTLGATVRRGHRGQGIASALVRRAIEFASMQPDLRRLCFRTVADNTPAVRLAQSLGFVEEGRLRGSVHLHGRDHDQVCFVWPGWGTGGDAGGGSRN